MTHAFRTRVWAVVLFCLLVASCAAGIWRYAYLQGVAQLDKQGRADLTLATDRFTGELRRFRELAVLLADHPTFEFTSQTPFSTLAANAVLRGAADKSGALALFLLDQSGTVLARAGDVERPPQAQAYFQRAMRGALGSFYGRLGPEGRRVYAFAAPVFARSGQVRGAVIVLVDMAEVEWDWIGGTPAVFFSDAQGRVFLSNRSEILGWKKHDDALPLAPEGSPAPDFRRNTTGGFDIWHMDWGDYLPTEALHLRKTVPVIGMVAHALLDTAPARRVARLQTSVFAMICMIFGVGLLLLSDRRRRLALANAELERRVARRTAELSAANTTLRREVRERQDAEAALKKAQDELVQAGKLSALGQMSAGISHELNQPLMAIRQFADNGTAFLDKGRPEQAAENLSRIGQLAARAARIIKNLRAFSRNESEPMGKVDLVQVIDSAIELTTARLETGGVVLSWDRPSHPVYALGGEVRLAQVFVNLITNAADAMTDSAAPRIEIALHRVPRLSVTVRDCGPGITEPDKIFEPFYTTKAVGSGDGMGLGLSISYGLVQSFGGNIHGVNASDGGAVFTVELEPWSEEVAA